MTDHTPTNRRGWRSSRLGFAIFFFCSLLLVYTALRVVLFFSFRPLEAGAVGDVLSVFLVGGLRDILVGLLQTLPLLAWMALVPRRWFERRWHRTLLGAGLLLYWSVQVFILAAEYYFFEEFRSRFNTVAVDYLLYPHEVFINIWDTYPVPLVVVGCVGLAAAWLIAGYRLFDRVWKAECNGLRRWLPLGGAVVLLAALVPTVSLKETRVSGERLLNEMANNGALAFVTAAWTRHLDYAAFYRTLPLEESYRRVRRLLSEPRATFADAGASIRRRIAGDTGAPKLNVVIIMEESLGSEFWGSLGRAGETLTPQMDRLAAEEGLLFANLYASGNRTVRGFEGILSSFPPLPGDSIVKRDHSDNVETIARVLKRDGYATVFLYGGRGIFDSMRSFALQNGYDRFIEQKDFEQPIFATIWGVCDEDLLQRTVQECRGLARAGQPFLATVLTVSNHKPYTYPKGRIAEDPDQRKREYAVKYSDYALGQFFHAVRQEAFYTNTIIAVMADHGARVYGSQSIPIRSYEVPLLITGPAVVKQPARLPQLGCLLDVSPTILGLIGRPYESLFFGRDLLNSPPEAGRLLVNHNRDIGMYHGERLVVLGLKKTVEFYQGEPKTANMTPLSQPTPADREIERDCIALYQVADDLYVHDRFRIDPQGPQLAMRLLISRRGAQAQSER